MTIPNAEQIHAEHRAALMLCDNIEEFLDNAEAQPSYSDFQQSIETLLDLLVNVHYPHEQQFIEQFGLDHEGIRGRRCPDTRHVDTLASLQHLESLVNAAMNGNLVSISMIKAQAAHAVSSLAHLIDIEEHFCLGHNPIHADTRP